VRHDACVNSVPHLEHLQGLDIQKTHTSTKHSLTHSHPPSLSLLHTHMHKRPSKHAQTHALSQTQTCSLLRTTLFSDEHTLYLSHTRSMYICMYLFSLTYTYIYSFDEHTLYLLHTPSFALSQFLTFSHNYCQCLSQTHSFSLTHHHINFK